MKYNFIKGVKDEKNEWGDTENESAELDNRTALAHENDIVSALLKVRMPQEAQRDLMEYYDEDDSISRNVQSYVFGWRNIC